MAWVLGLLFALPAITLSKTASNILSSVSLVRQRTSVPANDCYKRMQWSRATRQWKCHLQVSNAPRAKLCRLHPPTHPPLNSVFFPLSPPLPSSPSCWLTYTHLLVCSPLTCSLHRHDVIIIIIVTECIVCVQGHDTLAFSFLSPFLFCDWVGVLWPQLSKVLKLVRWARHVHSSGAVWESRWPSWAVRPNEPSGFRGRKELLNCASALVTTCP